MLKKRFFLGVFVVLGLAVMGQSGWAAPFVYVSNLANKTLSVIDADSHAVVKTVNLAGVNHDVAVSPDGALIYLANGLATDPSSVVDTSSLAVAKEISLGESSRDVVVSPDGALVYFANFGAKAISVVNASTGLVTKTIPLQSAPASIALSPDGNSLYVAVLSDQVLVLNASTGVVTKEIEVPNGPAAVAVSPDGAWLYVVTSLQGAVLWIDTATQSIQKTVSIGGIFWDVVVSPDGTRVYAVQPMEDLLWVFDAATYEILGSIPVGDSPSAIAVGPDSSFVYVANNDDGQISVVDASKNAVVKNIEVGGNPSGLAVSPLLEALSSVEQLSFGEVEMGIQSSAQAVEIFFNRGVVPLQVSAVAISGPFAILENACEGVSLARQQRCRISVGYTPTALGNQGGNLEITTNANKNAVLSIPLSGIGVENSGGAGNGNGSVKTGGCALRSSGLEGHGRSNIAIFIGLACFLFVPLLLSKFPRRLMR